MACGPSDGDDDPEALARQPGADGFGDGFLVIDDEDGLLSSLRSS